MHPKMCKTMEVRVSLAYRVIVGKIITVFPLQISAVVLRGGVSFCRLSIYIGTGRSRTIKGTYARYEIMYIGIMP